MNRTVYWTCLALIAATTAVLPMIFHDAIMVSEGMLMLVAIPRLHDIGRSGWFVVVALAVEFGAALLGRRIFPMAPAAFVSNAAMVSVGACSLWLGSVPSQPFANPFGGAPSAGRQGWLMWVKTNR